MEQSVGARGFLPLVTVQVGRTEVAIAVMRVVMSGAASRWDIPLDRLDDIQLAVETLVGEESPEGGDFSLSLALEDEDLRVWLDGLTNTEVKQALLHDKAAGRCEGCLLDVRLVLKSVVDAYRVIDTGVHAFAVELVKRAR